MLCLCNTERFGQRTLGLSIWSCWNCFTYWISFDLCSWNTICWGSNKNSTVRIVHIILWICSIQIISNTQIVVKPSESFEFFCIIIILSISLIGVIENHFIAQLFQIHPQNWNNRIYPNKINFSSSTKQLNAITVWQCLCSMNWWNCVENQSTPMDGRIHVPWNRQLYTCFENRPPAFACFRLNHFAGIVENICWITTILQELTGRFN